MAVLRHLQNHPQLLERAFGLTVKMIQLARPLLKRIGIQRISGLFIVGEKVAKGAILAARCAEAVCCTKAA